MAKMFLLAILGAVLISSSQAIFDLSPDSNSVADSPTKDAWGSVYEVIGSEDVEDIVEESMVESAEELADDEEVEEVLTEEERHVGNHVEFPVQDMDDDELKLYLHLEEQIFWATTDEHVAFQLLKEKGSLFTKGANHLRRKRIVPLVARAAFTVGRALARRFVRSGVTRSGSRITRHYNGRGNYGDAVRDFNSMRPTNVRSFNNGRISGQTGTMGPHRVTVRNGSSGNSRPTLEIRSHGGDLVRKFRYNN